VCSLLLWQRSSPLTRKLLRIELPLAALMFGAIVYVQTHIVPGMEQDRAAVGGDITSVAPDNPIRSNFDSLHATSEKLEGTALFLGLAVVLLMAAEDTRREMPSVATR